VFGKEPSTPQGEFSDPLIQLPNVYGTHHIGASTDQAQEAIAVETVRIVQTYLETGRVLNVVNLSRTTPAKCVLVVRHHDLPGVLAHVFDILRDANVNVQETENIVFSGAKAAVARINLDTPPPDDLIRRMKATNPHVLDVSLVPLGAPAASHQLARSLSAW
jgi:D-3-phosphoglycerate dehydrogenase